MMQHRYFDFAQLVWPKAIVVLRFPVSRILGLLSAGETKEAILKSYPYLEPKDIDEALAYAAAFADEEIMEFA